MSEEQEKEPEKKPPGFGMRKISLHGYEPGQKSQDEFAERARREIEEELRKKQQK